MLRRAKWLLPLLPLLLLGLAHADRDPDSIGNWRSASRAPIGLAPDPAVTPEGVIQVYAARAVRWRGYFGVHTWIAAKPANAPAFTVYEVTGFRVRRGGSAVTISQRAPDGRWFGSAPDLLADVRGPAARRPASPVNDDHGRPTARPPLYVGVEAQIAGIADGAPHARDDVVTVRVGGAERQAGLAERRGRERFVREQPP